MRWMLADGGCDGLTINRAIGVLVTAEALGAALLLTVVLALSPSSAGVASHAGPGRPSISAESGKIVDRLPSQRTAESHPFEQARSTLELLDQWEMAGMPCALLADEPDCEAEFGDFDVADGFSPIIAQPQTSAGRDR
jgi:hypothetical protein